MAVKGTSEQQNTRSLKPEAVAGFHGRPWDHLNFIKRNGKPLRDLYRLNDEEYMIRKLDREPDPPVKKEWTLSKADTLIHEIEAKSRLRTLRERILVAKTERPADSDPDLDELRELIILQCDIYILLLSCPVGVSKSNMANRLGVKRRRLLQEALDTLSAKGRIHKQRHLWVAVITKTAENTDAPGRE